MGRRTARDVHVRSDFHLDPEMLSATRGSDDQCRSSNPSPRWTGVDDKGVARAMSRDRVFLSVRNMTVRGVLIVVAERRLKPSSNW